MMAQKRKTSAPLTVAIMLVAISMSQPLRAAAQKPPKIAGHHELVRAKHETDGEEMQQYPQEPAATVKRESSQSRPDVLKSPLGQPHEILWQAGKLNGLPEDGFQGLIPDEFSKLSSEEDVVHIRKPEEFIQLIRARQAFVVHLGRLKATDAILRIAVNSSRAQASEYGSQPCDYENRKLQIWWNDECVWWRWLTPGHSVIETYICSKWIDSSENLLTIQNDGKELLCIDAVWLEPHRPGPEMFAALEAGNSVDRDAAEFVPICAIKLPSPPDASDMGIQKTISLEGLPERKSPNTSLDALAQWVTIKESVAAESLLSNSQREVDKIWRNAIAGSLERGMLPVVETDAYGGDYVWELWAHRFGPFVGHWLLSGSEGDVERVTSLIHKRVPDARITWATSHSALAKGAAISGTDGLMIPGRCGYWGGRTDRTPGDWRLISWKAGWYAYEPFDHWLKLRAPYYWNDINTQRKQAVMLSEAMVQWWMAGGNKLVIKSAEKGDLFFPDGSGAPAVSWDAVRLLLQLGNGKACRSICNIVPAIRKRALADTYWAVAGDTNSINIALFAGDFDKDKTVNVTAPVPWVGPTRCAIDSVLLHERKADPEVLEKKQFDLQAIPTDKTDNKGIQMRGRLTFSLPLSSVQLVRLEQAQKKGAERKIFLPSPTKPSGPQNVRGMFQLRVEPLPQNSRIVQLRSSESLVDRLSSDCEGQVMDATLASLPAWSLEHSYLTHQAKKVPNVVPWESKSNLAILGKSQSGRESPEALRLYWNSRELEKATAVCFWIRTKETPAKSAGVSIGSQPASLLIGTCEKRERLTIKSGDWQMYTVKVDSLRDKNGLLPDYLTLWRDPKGSAAQEFELNGFLALYDTMEGGALLSPIQGQVQFHEAVSELFIALSGQAGKPGCWNCRLPYPIKIEKVKVVNTLRDNGDTAEDKKTEVGYKFTYHEKAQVLEVAIDSFPPASLNPSPSILRQLFPAHTFTQKKDLESVIVLRCAIRQ